MSDGYTLKELVNELRTEQREQTRHTAVILTTLQNIDEHLSTLNSKVAKQEKRLVTLEAGQSKFMVVYGIVMVAITTAITTVVNRVI